MELKEFVRTRNFAVIVCTLLGFGFILGIHFGYVIHLLLPAPLELRIGLAIEAVFESFFFGLGVAFLCIYGNALRKLDSGPLKTRCISIWLAMSYFFLSWYPHGVIHQFLTPTDPQSFVILEMAFHWPGATAALVLCYFQFDVLLISYRLAKSKKQLRNWTEADERIPPPWADFRYQALALGLIGAAGWLVFSVFVNPAPPVGPAWLRSIWVVIWVVDSIGCGSSFSFAWAAYNIIPRLPNALTRRIALICTACIVYITIIIVPHPVSHIRATPTTAHILALEFGWHGSVFITTGILAFYQFRFLNLAANGRLGMMISLKDSKGTGSTELHEISSSVEDVKDHKSKKSTPPQKEEITVAVAVAVEDLGD